jgi:nucleoside 2-deoxyribosyltransferase
MFFDRLYELKEELEKLGHEVILPSMEDKHALKITYGEEYFSKLHSKFIREHFDKINESDAILVANFDKNNIRDYIGGNVLLEMGKAFDRGIPIFLLNDVPEISYREEILAMRPIVLNGDLSKLKSE